MKSSITYVLALLVFFLSSCASTYNTRFLHKDAIPGDVTRKGYTLLIMKYDDADQHKGHRYINNKLEKLVATYPYPVVLVTPAELKSAKYADVKKYRYYLQPSEVTYAERRLNADPNHLSRTGVTMQLREQFFTDRQENKNYPLTGYKVGEFHLGVKTIMTYLNGI